MFNMDSWLLALAAVVIFATAGWIFSLARRDVSIVDSMWSIMFLIAAIIYAWFGDVGPRATLVMLLVTIWSVRLAGYITWRNWGEGEDYRYQNIRRNNSPNFALKSFYIVFGLQAVLAWFISLPLMAAISGTRPIGILDLLGVVVWIVGFVFESLGDLQLAQFKANPENKGKVLQSGLWSVSRHPNYFGNFCIWWGFYLVALSAGGWWSIASPLLMTILLLKVSGVAMLEKDIGERRPGYGEYIVRTNAFFPGPQRNGEVQ
jgi:steroid 5-alpha reductase family enzyme